MKILLQFPEGLKQYALAELEKYKKQGHQVYISASPCWGACDLALDEAKKIGAQKLIHYGHCKFHEVKDLDVEYKLFPIDVDLNLIKNEIKKIKKFKKVGLVCTVSHFHQLKDFKKIFRAKGFEVFVSKGKLARLQGQILGCDTSAADKLANKVDIIVYIGGGEFHPLGISASKPIFVINPFISQSYFINDKIAKKRKRELLMLLEIANAKKIGIIVSTKSGQFNLKAAEYIKRKLEEFNKLAIILITSEVNFESLKNFNLFDGFITTACPRLEDDWERVEKPIINISKIPQLLKILKDLEKT